MAEYIEKGAALAAMSKHGITRNMRANKAVAAVPSSDVAPILRAHWIISKEDYGVSPLTENRVEHVKYTCSNCGYETGTQAEKFVCCPICTARMDGGNHETD